VCGGGVVTRIILADVSGHGTAVADLARSLRELMRRNIHRKNQDQLVRGLNREFSALASMGRFATAVAATYLADRRELTISNAGHPRPLLRRADSRGWEFINAAAKPGSAALTNLPLGIDDAATYPQTSIRLARGDLVLFYTDALTESPDEQGRWLGEAGLLEMLGGLSGDMAEELGRSLLESIARRQGSEASADDMTFLLLRHDGAGPARRSLRMRLDVYAKVFGMKRV
jgi:serine phosphatase RsbU (regulator of sigma subunit)